MHVRILDEALSDLRNIERYIRANDPEAAGRVIASILTTINQLENFPFLGRQGRVEKTREISVPRVPYFVVYTLPDKYNIDIEAIFHVRQQYPPEAEE